MVVVSIDCNHSPLQIMESGPEVVVFVDGSAIARSKQKRNHQNLKFCPTFHFNHFDLFFVSFEIKLKLKNDFFIRVRFKRGGGYKEACNLIF
jgi:hypothetical protein